MATMNVSLPGPMKDRVEAPDRGECDGDQARAGRLAPLQRFVDEAEASGISPRGIGEIIAEARTTARERGEPE